MIHRIAEDILASHLCAHCDSYLLDRLCTVVETRVWKGDGEQLSVSRKRPLRRLLSSVDQDWHTKGGGVIIYFSCQKCNGITRMVISEEGGDNAIAIERITHYSIPLFVKSIL